MKAASGPVNVEDSINPYTDDSDKPSDDDKDKDKDDTDGKDDKDDTDGSDDKEDSGAAIINTVAVSGLMLASFAF